MQSKIAWWALAAMVAAPMTITTPAQAGYWRNGHHYQGSPRYYRHKCGSGNGAVGTIAGGVGGAVIGNALGGGTAGTILRGAGGALLGRHLGKKKTPPPPRC